MSGHWLVPLLLMFVSALSCARRPEPRHRGGIDPSTGVYTRQDEDLVVPDTVPLVLTRTYLNVDPISRQFGTGTTHPGEEYLIGDGATFQWAELILAQGGRIHFDRISPGTSAADGVFEHRATPTRFQGARLHREAAGWRMTFTDGATALYRHCNPNNSDICSILEARDSNGRGIRYVRDERGRLLEMRGETQKILFRYDDARRIVRAEDSFGRAVAYTYDERGHLAQVRDSDGTVRRYRYNERHEMTAIDEPWGTIENSYDGAGHVVQQRITYNDSREAATIRFAYTIRDGAIVQTDTTEFDGTVTIARYNKSHYRTSETLDAGGTQPLTVTYDRDPVTNVVRAARAQCRDGQERTADFRTLKGNGPEPTGLVVMGAACGH